MTKYTIFYSWQSDLPNNTNRSFISNCLTDAIKQLNKEIEFDLEVSIDRDTKDITGTPDIVNTIIEKINNCSVFVCDISIVNADYKGRKMPNPNVMFELGYAVKTLGWDKIITVYNLDYGKYDDIPFDLRIRRPLTYNIDKSDSNKSKKNISNIFIETIKQLHKEGKLENKLNGYIKSKLDIQIQLFLLNMSKLLYGYPKTNGLVVHDATIRELLGISYEEILYTMKYSKFLGFQIFQIIQERGLDIESFIKEPINFQEFNRNAVTAVISMIKYTELINDYNCSCFNSSNEFNEFYTYQKGIEKNSKSNISPKKGEGYFLGVFMDNGRFAVQDYGHFDSFAHEKNLLRYYEMKPEMVTKYSQCIFNFIQNIKLWIENTGNELITEIGIFDFNKLKI